MSTICNVTQISHQESMVKQKIEKLDIINSATTTPISLLVQSLVKKLCSLLEKDNIRANQLYNTICEKLHSMNLIDDSYAMGEFEAMRSQYLRALYHLVDVANEGELPMNPPVTRPIIQPSGLEWSRRHREFEEWFFIASGGFGSVFKARHRLDGVEYAVKKVFIQMSDVNSIKLHLSEVKIIASLNHPNIVHYKAAWLEPMLESDFDENLNSVEDLEDFVEKSTSPKEQNTVDHFSSSQEIEHCPRVNLKWATLYIQMTYCQQTLKQWLDNRNHHMSISRKGSEDFTLHLSDSIESACLESSNLSYPLALTHIDVIIDMFTQLVKGLHYIHFRGIIHHDIKPSNVFVAKNEGGCTVQLGDFGLACPLQQSHEGLGLGTPLYVAPEQLDGQCNPKSDMYSLGIILFEMVEPFNTEMERVTIITDLRKGQIPAKLTVNYPNIAHIIGKLVQTQPNKRFDCAQLLEELKMKNLEENKDETIKSLKEESAAKDDEIAKLKMMLAKFNYQ